MTVSWGARFFHRNMWPGVLACLEVLVLLCLTTLFLLSLLEPVQTLNKVLVMDSVLLLDFVADLSCKTWPMSLVQSLFSRGKGYNNIYSGMDQFMQNLIQALASLQLQGWPVQPRVPLWDRMRVFQKEDPSACLLPFKRTRGRSKWRRLKQVDVF